MDRGPDGGFRRLRGGRWSGRPREQGARVLAHGAAVGAHEAGGPAGGPGHGGEARQLPAYREVRGGQPEPVVRSRGDRAAAKARGHDGSDLGGGRAGPAIPGHDLRGGSGREAVRRANRPGRRPRLPLKRRVEHRTGTERVSGDRSRLPTEGNNPRTADIDTLEPRAILDRLHAEDRRAVEAVGEVLDDVATAVDIVVRAFRSGGRLIYIGAGTSGRLGVLDAAECPPTFGTEPTMVQAILAGGPEAMWRSREGAEDSAEEGGAAIAERDVGPRDVVFGIAAGSTTPFVIGALREAIRRGAATVFLTCVPPADLPIASEVHAVVAPRRGSE